MAAQGPSGSTLSTGDFAWLLGSLCQTHRIAWDAALTLQQFAPPYSLDRLFEAGKAHGFRFGEAQVRTLDWSHVTFPVVAFRSRARPCHADL